MKAMDDRDIVKICRLYFTEHKTQTEVAHMLGISRYKVLRALKDAKKRKIVTISVNDPRGDIGVLEVALTKKFGLKDAVIGRVNETEEGSAFNRIGEIGARYVERIIPLHRFIGVAWGRTLRNMVNHIGQIENGERIVVQLTGGMGTIEGYDTNIITMMLSQKVGGSPLLLQAPVSVRDPKTRDSLLKESKIVETLSAARKVDLALLGIGFLGKEGALWRSGYLSPEDFKALNNTGAEGVICGRFYDINGTACITDWDNRFIGLTLDEIRKIQNKVAIAMGKKKVRAIIGALRGGLVDVLITDRDTAKSVLER